ncbi:sigma-70 family RNA polymerase sigma factor [Tumebacillus sp. ITR2]|uniref:Sigma-70 family RNA polymerase sigma factor n=1 Tax=Tumebacillus amylolyticus TaxID=2801339 RepID=A0ABS1J8S1_9BACL|nr:sigma-70 family RNA polymerase sigma factor [Tumebacillus amylolyticus]MBL0386678.1 sigma-70 family RNA polymerase sigma factor [Tumebacillus amylolyticus]
MEHQIQRALQSAEAMTEFLRELEPFVYRVSYHLTGHRQDAEDLAQDSLLKVCRNLHSYRGDCAFQSWVYRICLNTQRDAVRKKKNVSLVEIQESSSTSEGFEGTLSLKLSVQKLLKDLPELDRQIFILRFEQDLSVKEVAQMLEMKEATVKTRLFRLRDRLREQLSPTGGEAL